MYVMMPIQVVSKACELCPRLKIAVEKQYIGAKITGSIIECVNYEECLLAIEMHEKGGKSDEGD